MDVTLTVQETTTTIVASIDSRNARFLRGLPIASLAAITAGQVLAWDTVDSRFEPVAVTSLIGAGAVTWAQVSKVGSSVADLETRSATDLTTGTLALARLATGADGTVLAGGATPAYTASPTVTAITTAGTRSNASGTDVGANAVLFGTAIGTSDLRMRRTATNTLTVDNGAGGAATALVTGGLAVGVEVVTAAAAPMRVGFTSAGGAWIASFGNASDTRQFRIGLIGNNANAIISGGIANGVVLLATYETGSYPTLIFATSSIGRQYIHPGGGVSFFSTTDPGPGFVAVTGAINATGRIRSSGGGVGYNTGAGGTVTQLTSKSTGVTLNKFCGAITMHNEALGAGAKASFAVSNNTVESTDGVCVWVFNGGTANAYRAAVTALSANTFTITVENITAGSLSESPVIGFAIIKAVTS